MDEIRTNGKVAGLPAGIPDEVKLLDDAWLSDQTAGGAMLTLLTPRSGEQTDDAQQVELRRAQAERDRAEVRLKDVERYLGTERSANKALLATTAELERRRLRGDQKLHSAESALTALMADAERLHQRKATSEEKLNTADAALSAAQAEVEVLRERGERYEGRLHHADAALSAAKTESWPRFLRIRSAGRPASWSWVSPSRD